MPNMDKTGPAGAGPMTGRSTGVCSGDKNIDGNCQRGKGFGQGLRLKRRGQACCCGRGVRRSATLNSEN